MHNARSAAPGPGDRTSGSGGTGATARFPDLGTVAPGTAVVVVDDRLGDVIPAAAVPALRRAAAVHAVPGLPPATVSALDDPGTPDVPELLAGAEREPVVLFAPDVHSAQAAALLEAGAALLGAQPPVGAELLDAVAVMDRLRSPGGCPWDAEQDHDSLRRYLVEETYELLDAIEQRDRASLREELGDVLLQVLFHARIAAEDGAEPFGVDEVAADLVGKLVSRHPQVFTEAGSVHDAESQQLRWDELKQREKQRESVVDGVATGQPAAALAAKLVNRADRAGVPRELLTAAGSPGAALFELVARARLDGGDPEDELRAAALDFDGRVRAAEAAARADGHDPHRLTSEQWASYWSRGGATSGNDHVESTVD